MTSAALETLPPPLRSALEARGFNELTAVQEAVLAPENRGRDLRISSQTGSGKTVALGIAAFEALDRARGSTPDGPTLLVIVPTRELAAQVKQELEWLYAGLDGLTLDVVTGGTSVQGERRRLERPPHVLVGTPGRLVDHLEAGALELGGVRELVLDEADQMLDLGFRDELESILSSTPEERRTHLVSATLPDAILNLAARFQSDALGVEGTALGEANADIEHRAYRVDPVDRYAALVNILLAEPVERTLVFVATRAGAAQLSDRLASDGFPALPLSGDLAQAQRTRTLAAFRTGVVRILVATDVAARGLDVPHVARVVHASPAIDAEVFTHRSGRTGRAGRKGASVMLVTPRQERKVAAFVHESGIELVWHAVPTAADVRGARCARLDAALAERAEAEEALAPELADRVRRLLEGGDAERLLAAALTQLESQGGPVPQELEHTLDIQPRFDRRPTLRGSDFGRRQGRDSRGAVEGVRFQINWGFHGGANPKRILAHVCRRGEIDGRSVNGIRIFPRSSTFEVPAEYADEFERRVTPTDERDPWLKIRRAWVEGHPNEGSGPGPRRSVHSDAREGHGAERYGAARHGAARYGADHYGAEHQGAEHQGAEHQGAEHRPERGPTRRMRAFEHRQGAEHRGHAHEGGGQHGRGGTRGFGGRGNRYQGGSWRRDRHEGGGRPYRPGRGPAR